MTGTLQPLKPHETFKELVQDLKRSLEVSSFPIEYGNRGRRIFQDMPSFRPEFKTMDNQLANLIEELGSPQLGLKPSLPFGMPFLTPQQIENDSKAATNGTTHLGQGEGGSKPVQSKPTFKRKPLVLKRESTKDVGGSFHDESGKTNQGKNELLETLDSLIAKLQQKDFKITSKVDKNYERPETSWPEPGRPSAAHRVRESPVDAHTLTFTKNFHYQQPATVPKVQPDFPQPLSTLPNDTDGDEVIKSSLFQEDDGRTNATLLGTQPLDQSLHNMTKFLDVMPNDSRETGLRSKDNLGATLPEKLVDM